MSKRKNKKNAKKRSAQREYPAIYTSGADIRVKPGTLAPDNPDIPIGGWAGTICEVDRTEQPPDYLVSWNQNTIDRIPPVFRSRCERDDFDANVMWLSENELEPDVGPPAIIEQPTNIVTAPLDLNNAEDRIRMILGVTSNDPIPLATEEMLQRYHVYLTANIAFPFKATYEYEPEPRTTKPKKNSIEVVRLLDENEDDRDEGLVCEVIDDGELGEWPLSEIDVVESGKNKQLVEDYAFWFCNWSEGTIPAHVEEAFRSELAKIPLEKLPPELRELLQQLSLSEQDFPQGCDRSMP